MPLSSKTPTHLKPTLVAKLQKSAKSDFIWGVVIVFLLIAISVLLELELIEKFYRFSRDYEEWELDDIFLSLFWIGVVSTIYTLRRMRDIKSLNKEIIKNAYYDPLTNLPNRILALDRLEKQLLSVKRYGGHIAVAFLDFNNFKTINDTYGHGVGDELIAQVGARLSEVVRKDETIARLGGDEFLLIAVFKDNLDKLPLLLDRIHRTQRKTFKINNHDINIKYSIGVAVSPSNGETADELVTAADNAMYEAKRSGSEKYVFSSEKIVHKL